MRKIIPMSKIKIISIVAVFLLAISLNGATAQNEGTWRGDWSGTICAEGYCDSGGGMWQFMVFDDGSVAGWFTGSGNIVGSVAGDIRGEVSDGVINATGEGSAALGTVSWEGEFSGSSCSGTWVPLFGSGGGTWSGEKVSDSIMVNYSGKLPALNLTENASIKINNVGPENPVDINISNSAFKGVNIGVKNDLSNVSVNISKVSKEFGDIGAYEAYKAMNISSNVANEDIENASIDFTVSKEWLSERGYSKENVSMLRMYEEQQEELLTEFTGQNSTHFNYSAETPGFSTFVVTASTEAGEETEPVISIENISLSKGQIGTTQVILNEVPSDGLTYVNVSVDIANSSVAEFTGVESFPDWLDLSNNSTFPSSTMWFKVGDLPPADVSPGDTGVVLATFTVEGLVNGTSGVDLTVNSFQNESYDEIKDQVTTKSGEVTIGETGPPQIGDKKPKDLTGNGLYEDVDGDDNFNFGDIIVFFQNFDSSTVQNNKQFFDFDGDGNLTFGDVIGLFNSL